MPKKFQVRPMVIGGKTFYMIERIDRGCEHIATFNDEQYAEQYGRWLEQFNKFSTEIEEKIVQVEFRE